MASKNNPEIYPIQSGDSSPKRSSPGAESLRELENFQQETDLDSQMEAALEEVGFTGRAAEPIEESEVETVGAMKLHLLVIPPGASPIYGEYDNPEELMTNLYRHLEPALLFQEVGSWEVYVFEGNRLPLVGDLARGSLAVRYQDRLIQIPEMAETGEDLPAGKLMAPTVVVKNESTESTSIFGDVDDDESSLF